MEREYVMHRFYVEEQNIKGSNLFITGEDVNHLKNVLRLTKGDMITVSDGKGTEYICKVADTSDKAQVLCDIISENMSAAELPADIILYQGLPKKDKMELIIQKTVELGVTKIVPVAMKRCIVKIEDDKLEAKKTARWQEIAKAAGKQSGRGIIPEICKVQNFKTAVKEAAGFDNGYIIVPYENAEGMGALKSFIDNLKDNICKNSGNGEKPVISVFIGPEGGFDEEEIQFAVEKGATVVSLGKRILRTETAGLTVAAVLMYELETV